MRILVLTGFLGSGKTSLLLCLARHLSQGAEDGDTPRVIILENEAGVDGVDDSLLRSAGLPVENLFAGCACCTVGTELIQAVDIIEKKYIPEWLILETTGLAYPGLIKENLWAACKKDCRVCTVVDTSRWARLKHPMQKLLRAQISCADTVLLNKIDLADENHIMDCRNDVASMNSRARIILTSALLQPDTAVWDAVLEGGETE